MGNGLVISFCMQALQFYTYERLRNVKQGMYVY